MCGRFTLTTGDRSGLAARFAAASLPEAGGTERFNVAPTEEVLVVTAGEDGTREGRLVRWGLVPGFAKDLKGPLMINARAETVPEKKVFARLAAGGPSRCLVLADGFYEWLRPEDPKGARVPFRFTVDGGAPFAMAGLWCWSRPGGEWLASATVLTCAPNRLVARLHDRMPAILPGPQAEAAWLSPQLGLEEAMALVAPLDEARMEVRPANPKVNKSGIDEGPELLVA
jgi:putative SOS response-associated peptidase YedK